MHTFYFFKIRTKKYHVYITSVKKFIMKKEKVLIRDNKKVFLKMFKKELVNEFQLTETSMNENQQNQLMNFDRFVYVVYNKIELIEFLKLNKRGSNVLVCLFDKQLQINATFMEEIHDLVLLEGYKTKKETIKDLTLHLKNTLPSQQSFIENSVSTLPKNQSQFHSFFKTVLLFR